MAILYLYLRSEDLKKEEVARLIESAAFEGLEKVGEENGIVCFEHEDARIGGLGIEAELHELKVPYDEDTVEDYQEGGNEHRHVRFDDAGKEISREYAELGASDSFMSLIDTFHDHGPDMALSLLRDYAMKFPKIGKIKDQGKIPARIEIIPRPAEPLTAAYVAIGAMNAYGNVEYANDPDQIRQKLADQHGGQLGIVMAAIMHAGILDTMMELRGNAVDGVFAYDIAEPFGELLMQRMIEQGFVTLAEQRSIADMLFKRLES